MATTIDPITSLDRTSPTFRADVDEFFETEFPAFSAQMNAAILEVEANTATASSAATTATTKAAQALVSQQAAAQSEINAAASANAPAWVSGQTYAQYFAVTSPIDFQAYRRVIAGAGTTDPSIDDVNWTPVIPESAAALIFSSNTFGAF